MKTNKYLFVLLISVFLSCKNKFDQPPLLQIPEGAELSVQSLKQRLSGSNSVYRFNMGDSSVYLTITMDESSGNIYKQVYAVDKNGDGILLKLLNSGGIYAGDNIRLNLNNSWLVCGNNMVFIDSIDLGKNVVKLSSGKLTLPTAANIDEINLTLDYKNQRNFQSKLVTISDVEFNSDRWNMSMANAIGKTALEHPVGKCGGNKIYVRTSGLASFAGKPVPSGHGSITGIIQQYNNEFTLLLRNYADIQMQGASCAPPDTSKGGYYLYKDFDDKNLNSGGWLNASVTGTTSWAASNIGQTTHYARIYNKTNSVFEACETWLISPRVDLKNATHPVLHFLTANSSTASPLSLMISTDYASGTPSTANWIELPYNVQKNSFTNFPSGEVNLIDYDGKKITVAFKYSGTSSSGSIWNVDNIVLKEK